VPVRFVYVLEDDTKFQKEICDAISFLDPKIQIRLFPKLENFADWLRIMMTTGPAAISMGGSIPTYVTQDPVPEGEAHQLVLVISKIEFLGAEQLGLLRKTRDLFVERQICTKEDPTAFVLTAFDDPHFKIRELEDRILNNVIFKPFDRLILIQHLTFAIDGRHPASKYTIANQKTTAVVEMLKDVEMEGISEVGIVTKSYREIPVGSVAKYYGTPFLTQRHRSIIAICQGCKPHPTEPKAFRCSFSFLAADPSQISSLRKIVKNKQAKEFEYDWRENRKAIAPDSRVHIVMLDEEEEGPSGIKGTLEKRFEGIKITAYESYGALHSDLDPAAAIQNRDANLKPFGSATWVSLHFDLAGLTYMGFETDQQDVTQLFGTPEAEHKKIQNWFSKALVPEHKEKYRHYVKTQTLQEDNVLVISTHYVQFYLKVVEATKDDKKFHLKVTELSKDEQIDWLTKNSRIKDPVDLLVVSHRFFNDIAEERWTHVIESLKKRFGKTPLIFMTSKKDFSDREEREFGKYVTDIFFKPIDRSYFEQKIKWAFPRLLEKGDKIHLTTVAREEIIKTANPVSVSEISEAGFVMQYYRSIGVGSFREIVLWQPYEIGAPELLATCNFVEEIGKDGFKCHFVFFGISDHFLKHIRVWIRDNYILSKDASGGG
jgi:hypothetical protein